MTKYSSRFIALSGLFALLAPILPAQVAGAANTAAQSANAATAAANAAQMAHVASQTAAATAAQSAIAANHSANASAQAAASNAANASHFPTPNSPSLTGATSTGAAASTAAGATIPQAPGTVNAGVANSTDTTAGRTADRGEKVDSSTQVDANGAANAPGLRANAMGSGQIAASLNTTETALQIRNATTENRDAILKQVDSSVDATRVALAHLRQAGRDLRGDARQEFNSAYDLVRTREHALRDSLKQAQRANADTSAAAQAQLASDYEAYAQAVAAAEAAAPAPTPAVVHP